MYSKEKFECWSFVYVCVLDHIDYSMNEMQQQEWQRFALKAVFLSIFLFYTNPSQELLTSKNNGSLSGVWSIPGISQMLGSHVRKLLFKEEFYNVTLASVLKHGPYSYSVGIAGFWVKSKFWSSIPGWFLIIQSIWAILENSRALRYNWLEYIASSLWFIFISQILESTFHNEKFESTFYCLVL